MDQTTRALAAMVSGVRLDRLPASAAHEARRRLLDSIACAAGAYDEPFCATIRQVAGRSTSHPAARIWGAGAVATPEMAGFANGTMVRYLDLSDTFLGRTAGHPSDMIPALVALAEVEDCPGARLLEAIVAAYELYCGLCDAAAIQQRGLDQSTAAALGAAGGAAILLGLPEDRTGQALALALSSNLNLYNVRTGTLSDWKACAGPNAARNGIFAATLAREGITGPSAVFEGRAGLTDVVGPLDWRLETATAPRIRDTHLKAHPVCYHGQSAVDAASGLSNRIAAGQIESITISVYDAAVRAMGGDPSRWKPTTRETADHSLPYTVAVTLLRGCLTPADYEAARLDDAEVAALMARTRVEVRDDYTAAYPAQASARVTILTRDGQQHTVEQLQPKGHAQNPMSDEELTAKLHAFWPKRWGSADGVVAEVERLEDAANVMPLIAALCPDA